MPVALTKAQLDAAADSREENLRDEKAIQTLYGFVKWLWPEIEPARPLVDNWHIKAICDAVQAQLMGDPDYKNLLVCIPPGFLKSIIISVMRPAWIWLHWPSRQSLYLSNTDDLAERDSRKTRIILKSLKYRRLVANLASKQRAKLPCGVCGQRIHPSWDFAVDKDEQSNFENDKRGFRICIPMSGRGKTGKRGDDIVWDDPLDADVLRKASPESRRSMLKDANETVGYVESTRINNPKTATRTGVMQRLDLLDPAGMRIGRPDWKVLNFPQHFDPDTACPEDKRTVRGELLCEAMWNEDDLASPRRELGPAQFSAQHEQKPMLEDGGLFRKEMMQRRYTEAPDAVAASCDEVAITVDCTFKGSESSDRVAMQVWGRRGATHFYLLDRICARMGFVATCDALRSLCMRWPMARLKLVESAANGPAVMDYMRKEFGGLVGFNPHGSSKFERAKVGAVPAFEGGNVLLPDSQRCPWIEDYISEMCAFSEDCANDDEVDATSQLLLRWTAQGVGDATEVALIASMPTVETSQLTRWSDVDRSQRYVIGVGVDWSAGVTSPSYAVVLDEAGTQVGRLCIEGGGEEMIGTLVSEEAFYWNQAEVVVGGERAELAHRVAILIARSGVKVRCRPQVSLWKGVDAVYSRADWVGLWAKLGVAGRAGLIGLRDPVAHAAVGSVRVGKDGRPKGESGTALPAEVVALLTACVTRVAEEKLVTVERQRRWKATKGSSSGGDAWSVTALHNLRSLC